jgi:hypothetical protein
MGSYPASLARSSGSHHFICLSLLSVAVVLVITCPVAFISAGIVGILGLRWMREQWQKRKRPRPSTRAESNDVCYVARKRSVF